MRGRVRRHGHFGEMRHERDEGIKQKSTAMPVLLMLLLMPPLLPAAGGAYAADGSR
jgi:hypothetical protein